MKIAVFFLLFSLWHAYVCLWVCAKVIRSGKVVNTVILLLLFLLFHSDCSNFILNGRGKKNSDRCFSCVLWRSRQNEKKITISFWFSMLVFCCFYNRAFYKYHNIFVSQSVHRCAHSRIHVAVLFLHVYFFCLSKCIYAHKIL